MGTQEVTADEKAYSFSAEELLAFANWLQGVMSSRSGCDCRVWERNGEYQLDTWDESAGEFGEFIRNTPSGTPSQCAEFLVEEWRKSK